MIPRRWLFFSPSARVWQLNSLLLLLPSALLAHAPRLGKMLLRWRQQWAPSPAAPVLLALVAFCVGDNPLVPGAGMADPHIHIFGDKAYLYSTRDKSPHSTDFEMPGWDVWRSSDLVHWDHLTAISPQQTYIGKQAANATRRRTGDEFVRFAYSGVLACFAADVIARNGVYAFFFSNGDTNMGVMTASSPSLSDAVDAIGRPLVSTEALPTVPPNPNRNPKPKPKPKPKPNP